MEKRTIYMSTQGNTLCVIDGYHAPIMPINSSIKVNKSVNGTIYRYSQDIFQDIDTLIVTVKVV